MRTEKDFLGERELPDDALYGINTLRASENFALNHKRTNSKLISAVITVKKAAAISHMKLDKEHSEKWRAIIDACDKLISGDYSEQFITEALQGGAGTSVNMNVNEVIAHISGEIINKPINYLDDVNKGQSTNDVYPTALRIAAIKELRVLSERCAELQKALQEKENEFSDIKKLGRTELMDAVPITLGESFGSYAQAVSRDRWRLYKVEERLRQVNIGGTAVGLANAAEHKYRFSVIEELRQLTDIGLAAAEYPMDITQNNDVFVEVSGLLKALAVTLMKISNDLRLMNSGPYGGLSEIKLPPMQQGSSIMPAKVNPVIPEMVMQVSMRVIANDSAITMAAAHGEFELNAFLPLIADSLLESLELLGNAVELFRTRCICGITANHKNCQKHLENSFAFAADYITKIGYERVAELIRAYDGRPHELHKALEAISAEVN